MKTVLKYRIDAKIEGEISYDETKPDSYVDALSAVNAKRKALSDLGAAITYDKSGPKTIRD